MPKAPRVSNVKSSRKGKVAIDEDANIAVESFKGLAVAPSFTRKRISSEITYLDTDFVEVIASKGATAKKHTYKTGQ